MSAQYLDLKIQVRLVDYRGKSIIVKALLSLYTISMDRAFSWVTKKIGIKTTPYKGMGVFAHNAIVKNELIIVMGGYIFSIEDENHLNAFNEDKPLEIAEDFSLSPQNESDMKRMPQHYFNHSCNPNVGFKGQLF